MKEVKPLLKLSLECILLGFCICFTSYQAWKCFVRFFNYPQASHLTLKDNAKTLLPDISICPQPGSKCQSAEDLIDEIMYINGTSLSGYNIESDRFWLFPKLQPITIYQALGVKCYIFSFPESITQTGISRLEMSFKDQVFVRLYSPGLFYDEIKSISVDGVASTVDPANSWEQPESKFEGNWIEADVAYEVIKVLSNDEEPCDDDQAYRRDDCLLNETYEELMNEVGCITPYVMDDKNVCKDKTLNDTANEYFLTKVTSKEPTTCLNPCTKIIANFGIRKDTPTDYYAQVFIDFPSEVKVITAYPSYEILSLIAEIGGYVGLFLGISVLDLKSLSNFIFSISDK